MKTLQNILSPLKTMWGVGDFGCPVADPLPPLPVSDDLAAQYSTEEMHALGWRVVEEHVAVPPPAAPPSDALDNGDTDPLSDN